MKRPLRQPTQKQPPKTVDGFFSSTGSVGVGAEPIKKRFSRHYQPSTTRARQDEKRDLNKITSRRSDGFTSRSMSIDDTSPRRHTSRRKTSTSDDDFYNITLDAPPRSRKSVLHKKKSIRKRLVGSFAVLVVAFVVAVGSLFAYGYIKSRQIFNGNGEGAAALTDNVDPSRLNGEGDGRINILILGKGGPGHEAPDLTDTLLLASIDPVQNEAALLSIPRDLYVQDANGFSTKINAVYANAKQASYATGNTNDQIAENAGLSAIKQQVSTVIGLPVHYYLMVNFQAFEDAIDVVGGLDIYIDEPLYDSSVAWLLGGDPLVADAGWQTLDGQRALLYARSRKGSARGDFDRTERQRDIIVALQQEVLSAGTFANPVKIVNLIEAFGDNVRTDLNGLDEVRRLYEIGSRISSDRIVSVGLADDPVLVTTGFADNLSVVLPVAGFEQYDEIRKFVRNTIKDGFLRKENARVVILNGTATAGLASARQEELESYGYNVVAVDNAPTPDYVATRLIDVGTEEHPYTESYLTRRLGVVSETATIEGLPGPETADFVIILGSNEAS